MLNIWICDDEKLIVQDLTERLERIAEEPHQIFSFHTGADLMDHLEAGKNLPDILFLDIELGDNANGITLGEQIQKDLPDMALILITGYIDHARDIFKSRPVYFLVKPFGEEKLTEAFGRAKEYLREHSGREISLKVSGRLVRIDSNTITYAESKSRKIEIHTREGSFLVYSKIDELLDTLPENFTSGHKSFLVNMNDIRYFSADGIVMMDGTKIPVSRGRYRKAREDFMHYFNKI